MNVKKIIKGIIGLGAMAGVAYAAYKIGESNGKINERFREKYGDDEDDIELDDDEDEIRFYDNMDEPDDECLAPKKQNMPTFSVSMHNFASLDSCLCSIRSPQESTSPTRRSENTSMLTPTRRLRCCRFCIMPATSLRRLASVFPSA